MSEPQPTKSYSGRSRRRTTTAAVRWKDAVARSAITVGGIGTIVAVLAVFVFLVWVVVPLFRSAQVESVLRVSQPIPEGEVVGGAIGTDELQTMVWQLSTDGRLRVVRLEDGAVLEERYLEDGAARELTAVFSEGDRIAVGHRDGSVRLGRIGFTSRFFELDEAPAAARDLAEGASVIVDGALAVRTPGRQIRVQRFAVELDEPIAGGGAEPVRRLDYVEGTTGAVVLVGDEEGRLLINVIRRQENLLTGTVNLRVRRGEIPYSSDERGLPRWLLVSGLGDNVYLVWRDGYLLRFDTRDLTAPVLAEQLDLIEAPDLQLTSLRFLIGRTTLVAGDATGRIRAWFRIKPPEASTSDGALLTAAHELPPGTGAITALEASERSRTIAVGDATGQVRLLNVTSASSYLELPRLDHPIRRLAVSPKDDGIIVETAAGLHSYRYDPRHPEVTVAAMFEPVWYEGYAQPEHVWQSSSGTDDSEPKYGLMPLVFGTLKATVFSMLFGVPLALLGAIYTSEFLKPSVKSVVKPAVELMASLPSVVLGFLAALVFAPVVEQLVATVIAACVTVPLALLTGAYLWQLLPYGLWLRWRSYRLSFVAIALPVGLWGAAWLGPALEGWLFAGNLKLWLDGQIGSAFGGWFVLFLPVAALATAFCLSRFVDPWERRLAADWNRTTCARADLLKFVVAAAVVVGSAATMAVVASWLGFDPRGSVVDTYVQRNSLVVGFVMGFAVIPIIYTIAEDALSSVPEHLRAASLGAGATQWQTATRVILPTAMSGLFSALMIGLGRAVGETMIVLMAAGNTPVMEWNVFNGFRTLSANIAVELPEAVRDSTHYRMLFLAALVLFVLTFAVNTVAELVRLRFRKRAYQL